MNNPFYQPKQIWVISITAKYKDLEDIELLFEEEALAISSHELSSNTIEAMPEDIWSIDIYLTNSISNNVVSAKLRSHNIQFESIESKILENKDWLENTALSLGEIITDKFHIIRSEENLNNDDKIPLILNISRAFGTGEHATTLGCLQMIEKYSYLSPKNIIDIGTGTGILGIAAKKLLPNSNLYMTDIDEIAIEVAKSHAKINNIASDFVIMDGVKDFAQVKTFDMIIANILANPLIQMAPDILSISNDDSVIILSGFLQNQAEDIIYHYSQNSFINTDLITIKDWTSLVFFRAKK